MSDLISHLEAHLGPITSGLSDPAAATRSPIQVAWFDRGPLRGASILSTIGLSHTSLRVGETSRRLRQELVMMFRGAAPHGRLAAVLHDLASEAVACDRAFGVGDVIGPRGPLASGSKLEAFYVALPVYLPDSFQVVEGAEPIVIGWLVAITAREAMVARSRGRAAFEDLLLKVDPDLLDLGRASLV